MPRLLSILLLVLLLAPAAQAAERTGANAEKLWSLKPVMRPELPAVQNPAWIRSPVDHFILAGLDVQGWQPAAAVSKEKLIRRTYFDLWGLPPAPQDVRDFVADNRGDAYERLIDRLLASHHYGERWARHWLDVVRFAETNGYERDALKPNAWQYRDWVIQSLNDDKPYDRFVIEQLAGDELPDATDAAKIATGFLRVGTFDDEPNDPAKYKFEQLDDLMHATSTAFLAVTLKCARCHDHKFDPIPQTDYYAVLNFFVGGKAAEGQLLAFTETSPHPPEVQLLTGGDPATPGEKVAPGYLSMIPELARAVDAPGPDSKTSGRRLQLAHWITDAKNPLAARVMVNRLWQHHFGEGIVRTPDNFGTMSSAPTHPEMLDWLASELVDGGWRLKRLHKLIMLSNAYQMDSTHPHEDEYAQKDFINARWWKRNRLRLESEPLRDAMLATSGQLNLKAGGPSFFPPATKASLEGLSMRGKEWGQSPPEEQRRRTIYMMTKRSLLLPLLTTFDFADTTQPCSQRNVSTVAPQALALLNNGFVHEQSNALADRLLADCPTGDVDLIDSDLIDRAWWLALSRAPRDSERSAAQAHLTAQRKNLAGDSTLSGSQIERQALASLCHVLLNLNEYIYVD